MLETILEYKRAQLDKIDRDREMSRMMEHLSGLSPARDFAGSLRNEGGIALIAEIKRRSPSKGLLADDLPVARTAQTYQKAGARAISVLTESGFFDGSIDDLKTARASVTLPVLRKDFIIDPYQVVESRYIGADAILLIAGILPLEQLRELYSLAVRIGLAALVEVHNEEELEKALAIGPEIIGINNRNLRDFKTSLAVAERLAPRIPGGIIKVSESGISERDAVRRLQECGMNAVLVGEAIIRCRDKEQKIRELLGTDHD